MERHPVSVTELLAMAHEGTQLVAQSADISIAIEVASGVSEMMVSVDSARLQQVLVNLIINAVKFSSAGSTITLSADAPGDGTMHITVRDQGRGIPADMISHVFDRFVQIHPDDAKERLGLPIAKAIVEQHGGRIWAESELDHGSIFHLTLPIDVS
jgi:signal transduction histidine kinase